jgi:NADH-quinone oxidoreductase subunit C
LESKDAKKESVESTKSIQSIVPRLQSWDPTATAEVIESLGETTLVVRADKLRRICEFLATDPDCQFSFLSDITPVDNFPIEPRFELNYHMLSIARRQRLRLKLRVSGQDPVAPSVTSVWPAANWHEREAFDLMGIRFEGHPDLSRILMPDDWEGHPLRKDYPVEGFR